MPDHCNIPAWGLDFLVAFFTVSLSVSMYLPSEESTSFMYAKLLCSYWDLPKCRHNTITWEGSIPSSEMMQHKCVPSRYKLNLAQRYQTILKHWSSASKDSPSSRFGALHPICSSSSSKSLILRYWVTATIEFGNALLCLCGSMCCWTRPVSHEVLKLHGLHPKPHDICCGICRTDNNVWLLRYWQQGLEKSGFRILACATKHCNNFPRRIRVSSSCAFSAVCRTVSRPANSVNKTCALCWAHFKLWLHDSNLFGFLLSCSPGDGYLIWASTHQSYWKASSSGQEQKSCHLKIIIVINYSPYKKHWVRQCCRKLHILCRQEDWRPHWFASPKTHPWNQQARSPFLSACSQGVLALCWVEGHHAIWE